MKILAKRIYICDTLEDTDIMLDQPMSESYIYLVKRKRTLLQCQQEHIENEELYYSETNCLPFNNII